MLEKNYTPNENDPKWYRFWEEGRYFSADPSSKKEPYCIVIPPPNVTGMLHMGHALVNTLQDIMIRFNRMRGKEALWVPGTDHAGISTQTVVERHLIQTQGKKRTDFDREEFLKYVWEWKEQYEERIIGQLKRLGCSCDWERKRFTMDEKNNGAVRETFKKLFDAGLIYRGDYLVNWDPVTQTALADDEVEYEERSSHLWHIRYPLEEGSGHITVATTRPETMLGDTAVAVSASDERYKHLIGKKLKLPLTGRLIPIIADHRVDPEFGTGAVKITPAHDPNDYQMGLDHSLPFINIMTPDGCINENGGKFAGLSMEEARGAVVEALKEQGHLEKTEPHTHRVGISYRSKAVIEPYMSKQWFVRMEAFAKKLESAVAESKVKILPTNWESVYYHWIRNLRDWCISRQLWWGHRIPIWHKKDGSEEMLCYAGEGVPPEVEKNPDLWEQDPDVLDTWFSSALWPFAALGWPEKTAELEKFYPNSVLITGHDILFFWVARMILMGEFIMEKPPFPEVFLHGLIFGKSYWRDKPGGGIAYVTSEERRAYELGEPTPKEVKSKWEKMSKSKGNILDPLEIIEEYGTDAVRMALCSSATSAREIDLDRRKFEEYRNFANKVWNGARFVMMNLDLTGAEFSEGLDEGALQLEDRWILSKLSHTIQTVTNHLDAYEFDQAAIKSYDFFWKEFCAYYVEISKPTLFGKAGTPGQRKTKQKLLAITLLASIRLLHPMAPFITEELFSHLKEKLGPLGSAAADPYTEEALQALSSPACIVAPFPRVLRYEDINIKIEEAFDTVEQVIYTIRNIRGEMKLPPQLAVDVYIVGKGENFAMAEENRAIIAALVKVDNLHFVAEEPKLAFSSTGAVGSLKLVIPLPDELLDKERGRLEKEMQKLAVQQERIEAQLQNKDFVDRAPKELVEKQKEQLQITISELGHIKDKLAKFK